MAYIEFNNVFKVYKMGEVEINALSNTSFKINKGELVCILGPSGAGKTTCLNILGGMDNLTSGEVFVDGKCVNKLNGKELIKALNNLVEEKNISADVIFEALELALQTAYKKNFNSKTNVRVNINRETGDIKVYSYYVVVPEIDEGSVVEDEEGNVTKIEPEINRDAQILLEDAIKIVPTIKIGETIEEEVTPKDFGRVAAGTAKQVVMQKIREVERLSH